METVKLPILGITMGDPFGNGPEITVRALADEEIYKRSRPLVVGDASSMRYALKVAEKVSGIHLGLNIIQSPAEGRYEYGTIDLMDMGLVPEGSFPDTSDLEEPKPFRIGACASGGEAAFRYVEKVISLALNKEVDATVTNALSKEAIHMAGHMYSGHTEIYAEYTNTEKYSMMLAHEELRVVHVSTHVSMREACDRVKKARVLDCIHIADAGCKALGIEKPKIGVCGLNAHAGENGLFGREEIEEIQPAIDEALKEGVCIPDGAPIPPDTAFSKALGGWYDILVVMYHDQGHIPLKVRGFVYDKSVGHWDAVAGINVTLGLPIIRVSVDHGTGFGHAGDGHANELSLKNAIDYAIRFANARKE